MMTPSAAQAYETDPLVVAIVSVILTLIVGVVVGLVTALLARKGEHAKWLRERRYEAYVAFITDMDAFIALANTKPTMLNAMKIAARSDALTERMPDAFEAVSLLGPREVNATGQQLVWAANDFGTTKDEQHLADVGAARWQFLLAAGKVLKSKNVTPEPMVRPNAESVGAADRAAG